MKILFKDQFLFIKRSMTKKELNLKQVRWAQILIIYNFEIFHRSNNKNSTNDFSRRLDYKKVSLLKITLLSILQNKLILLLNEESRTQNERKNSIKLTLILRLKEISIRFDVELAKLTRNKQNILIELTSIFKLIDIQIIISRKVINKVFDNFYKKLKNS